MSKVFHAASWQLLWTASVAIFAAEPVVRAPRIWDDQALEDWATPIAALGFCRSHYTAAEDYAAPGEQPQKPIRSIAPPASRPEIRFKEIHSLIWRGTGEVSPFEGEIEK